VIHSLENKICCFVLSLPARWSRGSVLVLLFLAPTPWQKRVLEYRPDGRNPRKRITYSALDMGFALG